MLHLRDTWALRGLPALPCRTLQGGAAPGSGGFLTQFARIKVEMIQGKVWKSRWKFIKCAFAFNLNLMHIYYKQCRNSLLINLQLINSSAQKNGMYSEPSKFIILWVCYVVIVFTQNWCDDVESHGELEAARLHHTVQYSTAQYSTSEYSIVQHSTAYQHHSTCTTKPTEGLLISQ